MLPLSLLPPRTLSPTTATQIRPILTIGQYLTLLTNPFLYSILDFGCFISVLVLNLRQSSLYRPLQQTCVAVVSTPLTTGQTFLYLLLSSLCPLRLFLLPLSLVFLLPLWLHLCRLLFGNARSQFFSDFIQQQSCICSGSSSSPRAAEIVVRGANLSGLLRSLLFRMSAAGSDDPDHPATAEPPPTPVPTQRNDSVLKRSSAELSIMMMLRIPQTSPPPTLSISSPPMSSSSSLPCPLCSPSASPTSCVTLEQVTYPSVASRSSPQTIPGTASINLSTAVSTTATPKTATATTATPATSTSSSTGTATKTTMMMTIMSPPTSSARRSTASVQNWFQSELDVLGIESVYSRYIISLLLQQDNYHCSADPDLASSPECTHVVGGCSDGMACSHHHQYHHHHRSTVSNNNNNNNNSNNNNNNGDLSRSTAAAVENKNAAAPGNNNNSKCGSSGGGNGIGGAGNGRRQRSASRRDRQQPLSAEQRKKREAVGCLLEICDDIIAGDIEDLIEELMLRLKQVDNETSITQPVISSPSANNNNPASTKINVRQDPAEQYYAAFPALSTDTRMTSQTQSSQITLISGTDVSNVWKKKQQQSQKLAPTLSTQTDNSINSEGTATISRSNNASSRRRRGCFSHHGNKENLHKPPFTLRGKDDRGSRYSSHTNRLRGGRGRSGRLLVSDTRQKLSQSSSSQPSARNVGTRHYEGVVSGGTPQTTSDGDYCLNVENILKDILRTANKNSSKSGKVSREREAPYPYNCTGHFVVPKMESGLRSHEGRSFKKMSRNLTGKAFEENSAWYDISFLDNSNTSSDKDVPLVSPPPLSIMGVGPSTDEKSYVRLYKRHSYLPSSPRSVLTLEGLGEKDVFRKFTSRLGSHADPDPKQKIVVTASVANLVKKHLAPERTDNIMYAATETVVDSSVRSLLDCSPEEVLPSAARRPSDELQSLLLLPGYPPLADASGHSPYLTDGSIDSSCTFAPTTTNLSPCDWSASPIKALSPSGVASPTTPVSSPNSTTSLSLLDISYLTNMADREKGSLDTTQKENPKIEENALSCENIITDELNGHVSSLFKSPCKLVAEIKAGRRNFAHEPYAFASHARSALTEDDNDDEFFDLAMTPTPSHGAVGQALYGATNYRPWSYALVEEIVSEVQTSDILALNERLSQVWDVNYQRRVIPTGQTCRSRTNFNYSQHTPNLDSSPSFLLELSTPSVTPFTFFFSSVLSTPPPPMEDCGTNEKSASDSSEKTLPAALSCTDSTRASENLSGNSIAVNKPDAMLSTILDDSISASPSSSSSPNVKLALTMATTVVSSSLSAISSLSSGTSSSSSSPLPQEPQLGEPSHGCTLVPSVNSAFERVVPRQNKAKNADHVKQRLPPEDEEVMRQVNPHSSPRETLYFSPKTHFQPIRSPLPFVDTLELSLSENVTTKLHSVAKSSDPLVQPTEFVAPAPPCLYQPPDLFGGHTISRSPYQLFQTDIYWEDDIETPSGNFVPSFKILKDHDKFVQTGNTEENLDVDLEKLADDVCTENTVTKSPSSVSYSKTAGLRTLDPVRRADRFASVWSQTNTLSDLSAWPQGETGKDARSTFVNAWTTDPPSGWTPITSTDRWPSTFSSPSSLGTLERHPYIFARDSVWYTTAGTLSAVRDDAWLSSSSGTPNSGLSTPCTASAGPPRINVVCKTTSKIPDLSLACVSPGFASEEEDANLNGSIWSSNSVDWTVNATTPVYLQVNPRTWATDEGCGETVVEGDAFKFTKPELNSTLLSPETLMQPSSSQSVWSNNIWEPGSYDIPQDEAVSRRPISALSLSNSFLPKENATSEREISTEEEPASEDQDGSRSLRFDSANIWSIPNATMWSLPILTHSSSSSTSASQAASPSSAPSPPLVPTHQLASSDPLLDLVCGSTCTQTVGASKPCQHQQLRKIWEHIGHGDSGDKKENTNNSAHQMYGGRDNRPLFGSAKNLASLSVSPPGDSSCGSSHWTPTSNTLSLGPPSLVPLPSAAVYSSELEKQWLSGENSCSSSAASVQQTKMQREKSRSCKKPCSYYLEGHCWRQECKYAHDICTITCRFWEEMECFKGDTCPFLHGYSGETIRPSTDSCSSGCSSSSNSSSSSITRRTETSPSIAATIHTSSVTHPSAPPEEFDKECRSLTQSKAQLSDTNLTTKADPQGGNIPALGAADVPGQASAAAETTPTTTDSGSGSDTLPNTVADPGCNGNGIGGQGASSIAPPTVSSSPPPFAS